MQDSLRDEHLDLDAIERAWDALAEWRACGLDPATVGGPDFGPGHCDDCEARWAPVWRGVPALVARVRALEAALHQIGEGCSIATIPDEDGGYPCVDCQEMVTVALRALRPPSPRAPAAP